MARTLGQIQEQIAELQRDADEIKSVEVRKVIAQIKEAIAHYGLTASGLGFIAAGAPAGGSTTKAGKGAGRLAAKSSKPGFARVAKYADANGNTGVGIGNRPQWLRDALAQGKQLSEFLNP